VDDVQLLRSSQEIWHFFRSFTFFSHLDFTLSQESPRVAVQIFNILLHLAICFSMTLHFGQVAQSGEGSA